MLVPWLMFLAGFLFGSGIVGYSWFLENAKKKERDKEVIWELFKGIRELYPELLVCSTLSHAASCLMDILKREKTGSPIADMHYQEEDEDGRNRVVRKRK